MNSQVKGQDNLRAGLSTNSGGLHTRLLWVFFLIGASVLMTIPVWLIQTFLPFEYPIPWNDETAFLAQAYALYREGTLYVSALNLDRTVLWMPPGFMVMLAGLYNLLGYSFELSRDISAFSFWLAGVLLLAQCGYLPSRRQLWGLGVVLLALINPFSLVISNIARMEALCLLLWVLSLVAVNRERWIAGLGIVLISATVHFNAIYFLWPFLFEFIWGLKNRRLMSHAVWEWCALGLGLILFLGYAVYATRDWIGLMEDMRFQFGFKFGAGVMGGPVGVVSVTCAAVWNLGLSWIACRDKEVTLVARFSLYGTAFLAMAMNGNSMWYDYGLALAGALMTLSFLALPWGGRWFRLVGVCLILVTAALGWRSTLQMDGLLPGVSHWHGNVLSTDDRHKVAMFLSEQPKGTRVSFGYSGWEPFFFNEMTAAGTDWNLSRNSVTEPFPVRDYDFRVLCDSSLLPAYLQIFEWEVPYQRRREDTGCRVFHHPTKQQVR